MEYQEQKNSHPPQDVRSVYVDRSQKEVTCPLCNRIQRSDRYMCYNCNVPFVDIKDKPESPAITHSGQEELRETENSYSVSPHSVESKHKSRSHIQPDQDQYAHLFPEWDLLPPQVLVRRIIRDK